jgi:drug/metabolite transporter (DMT)-like permease
VIKSMAGLWSPVAVAALRFTIAAVGLGAFLLLREGAAGFRLAQPRAQFGRGAALAVSSTIFITSLFVLPLATATAIGFTAPMFTAILAALLLGEPLRRETLIASVVAFAGVLVILRPNLAEAGWWAVLPLFSAMTFSLLIIGNRHVDGTASALAMQFWVAAFATPILLLIAPLFAREPTVCDRLAGVERHRALHFCRCISHLCALVDLSWNKPGRGSYRGAGDLCSATGGDLSGLAVV